jgi:small-conductance mechanosensitive channel
MEIPWIQVSTILVGSLVGAYLVSFIINRTLVVMARKTKTDLDDQIIAALHRPIFLSVIFYGLSWIVRLQVPLDGQRITYAILQTLAILVWSRAAFKVGTAILQAVSRHGNIVQPRTMPVFNMLIKGLIVGGAVYFTFIVWDIDLTAWMASAGIIGIAVGFAAKDTLANLFAGIFILADAPYKVGDFIVVDESLRGQVTNVGMRSTRMLTRDDIEITIPNHVIGNSKIVNEAGGPSLKQRVRIYMSVAYGTDIDEVSEVLLECPKGLDDVSAKPIPEVRFRKMADSGLDLELMVWTENSMRRGRLISELNKRCYKALMDNGFEIPFPQRDLRIREMPASWRPDGSD